MYKDFQSKFSLLCEEETTRFRDGGFLNGDIVKIRSDWANNGKLKGRPSQFMDKIKELIAAPYPLRVTAVKSERPETQHDLYGIGSAPTAFWADVAQIINPGFWTNPITLPIEVLELVDTGANLPPVPDEQKYDNKVQIKPVEPKKGKKNDELEQQTNGQARQIGTENKTLETVGKEAKDGRKQAKKPVEYKRGKTQKESITYNNFAEDDELISEVYKQVKAPEVKA